ncbi:MAG TPA: RpiB/LacA/LacB family sugar-phosphate isomerase [Bacteroidales bacterium]|jgi:ribose 5-phosphate isomerase B|nr:RpiB/LacA/LacB family sugar-phosphate isomerase [Bacteroidales bacterium]
MEKIGIAADHGGYDLKEYITAKLREKGYEILDFGNNINDVNDDYPDYVIPLARAVGNKEIAKGIAVCGSGVGACVAANKISGTRACLINETYSAHQGVEHDDMNLICLGGRVTGNRLAMEIVESFLAAKFTGEERHLRRLAKISALE